MSGYDLFGFHTAHAGEHLEGPPEGAVRVDRSASVDTNGSDSSGERSTSLANFSYDSSLSSKASDKADAEHPAARRHGDEKKPRAAEASESPARPKPLKNGGEGRGSVLDASVCSLASGLREQQERQDKRRGTDTKQDHPEDEDGRDSVPLSDTSTAFSFTDFSALDESIDYRPDDAQQLKELETKTKEKTKNEPNTHAAQNTSGTSTAAGTSQNGSSLPIVPKSILNKVSSFRRPPTQGARYTTKGATSGSGSGSGTRTGPSSAPTSQSPSRPSSGWKVADDSAGFYVPTDIMQDLDLGDAAPVRSYSGTRRRSSGSAPRHGNSSRSLTGSQPQRHQPAAGRKSEPQRRLSKAPTALTSTETSMK